MKYLTIIILTLIGFASIQMQCSTLGKAYIFNNGTGVRDSLILWDEYRKLSWDDFKGIPDEVSDYKAITSSFIGFTSITYGDSIVLSIPCYFVKTESWSKNKMGKSLLSHEQLHFDVAEIIARKIRKECSTHISKSLEETSNILQSYYDKYYGEYWDNINNQYDSETDHGIIESKQKEWEQKIAKELKSLEVYSSPRVVVRRR